MFVLIDNYDSFTYNLYHYLGELGATLVVHRNDKVSVDDVMKAAPQGIILSPGPCTPTEAGICLDLVHAAAGHVPLLGVCLGHQAIGQAFGGKVVRAAPMHGKVSTVHHNGRDLFEGIEGDFIATRYHSLVVERASMPDALEVTADTDDGTVMALRHRKHALWGVQFHPESIESQHGHRILGNFLRLAGHNADAAMLRKSA
jgi:anthranilate synthase/aminodeoxychorismate synthase-like glutamine amidotransferase